MLLLVVHLKIYGSLKNNNQVITKKKKEKQE